MRADRLVSLVLLLRQGGRMSAPQLARELEVLVRTVLRDIDALSTAGVPVYAERGRHGGYALLPGFRTELTGLTHEEALALLAVGAAGRAGPSAWTPRRPPPCGRCSTPSRPGSARPWAGERPAARGPGA